MFTLGDNQKKGYKVLHIHDADNVGVAMVSLQPGEEIAVGNICIRSRDGIEFGHKIALSDIGMGDDIIKYGVSIGVAAADIAAGDHVHTQNMKSRYLDQYSKRREA